MLFLICTEIYRNIPKHTCQNVLRIVRHCLVNRLIDFWYLALTLHKHEDVLRAIATLLNKENLNKILSLINEGGDHNGFMEITNKKETMKNTQRQA